MSIMYIPDADTARKIILTMFPEVQERDVTSIFNRYSADEAFRYCARAMLPTLASTRETHRIMGETILTFARDGLKNLREDDPAAIRLNRQIKDIEQILRRDELNEAQVKAACEFLGIELEM